jgi:quercetin dioxygenase-like cupin family protein
VQSWNLVELDTPGGTRSPIVLHSTDEARAVLIGIDPGQELGDHQVHENAYIVVVAGRVRVEAGSEALEAGPGTLVRFEEKERHRVSSLEGARVLMILAPWPGPGHYRGSRDTREAGAA